MPNGTMTGSGTSDDPYIVMDAYDFNALRNIMTFDGISSSYVYLEFGADIDMSVIPNYQQIWSKAFNIDGKGHKIININIKDDDSSFGGLFGQLYVNDYLKDLTVVGKIDTESWFYAYSGLLCASLYLASNTVMSNVNSFFEIICSMSYDSNMYVGGIAGTLWIESQSVRTPIMIEKCGGKCSISAVSTYDSATPSVGVGGIFGAIIQRDSTKRTLNMSKCYSDYSVKADLKRGNINIGGIFANFSTSNYSCDLTMDDCVSRMKVEFSHTEAITSGIVKIGGIVVNPGATANATAVLNKCVAFIDVYWKHVAALRDFRMAGLLHSGNFAGQVYTINQGYAVMKFHNPDGLPWTGIGNNLASVTYLPSTTPAVTVNSTFFDKDVFEESYDGIYTATHGISTNQLKNRSYLEGQGWVFD